jgi:hypothetical protein
MVDNGPHYYFVWAMVPYGYTRARQELIFWKTELTALNFRMFTEPTPSCVGWVDASDHAIGGVLAELNSTCRRQATVTMDN